MIWRNKMAYPHNKGKHLSQEEINERYRDTTWKIISEYKGSNFPVDIQCKICGEIRLNVKTKHIRDKHCFTCEGNGNYHTLESFNESIAIKNWIVEGEFNGTKQPCEVRCLTCGDIVQLPLAIKAYTRKCKNCTNKQVQLKKEAKQKIIDALAEKGFDLIKYKNTNSEALIKCGKCGNEQILNRAYYVHYFPLECINCGFHICKLCEGEFIIDTLKKNREFCYKYADPNVPGSYARAKLKYRKKIVAKRYGNKCIRCGYDESLQALEFHHKNPKNKHPEYTPCELIRLAKEL